MLHLIVTICMILLPVIVTASEPVPAPAHLDNAISIAYPVELAMMTFRDAVLHDKPGKGYTLRYGNDYIDCEIDVFDNGLTGIPDGHDSPVIAETVSAVKQSFQDRATDERITDLRHRYEMVLPQDGTVQFHWLKTEYKYGSENAYKGPMVTETFVTGRKGRLFKITLTYKKQNVRVGSRVSRFLPREMEQILEKKPS